MANSDASRRALHLLARLPFLGVSEYKTTTAPEFIDITEDASEIVAATSIRVGWMSIFSQHTTAAIKLNENEPFLISDMVRMLCHLAPANALYEHNDFSRRTMNVQDDEFPNGHAHCQHLLLGSSETIPIKDGQIALGTWQRIFLIELDRPRTRRVHVGVLGFVGGATMATRAWESV